MTTAQDTRPGRSPGALLRLGDLARATGLRPQMIQRWEKRYGFPDGGRTPAGQRCYTSDDVTRVNRLVALRQSGMSLKDAIRAVTDPDHTDLGDDSDSIRLASLGATRAEILEALDDLDEPRLWSLLDTAADTFTEEDLIEHVLLPAMRTTDDPEDLRHPERIQAYLFSRMTVSVLNRLAARHRPTDAPIVWLACPEGEAHEVGTLAAAVLLAKRGLDVRYFGPNVPLDTLLAAAKQQRPDAILLGVTRSILIRDQLSALSRLCEVSRVFLGGRGAWRAHAVGPNVLFLEEDVITSADMLTRIVASEHHPSADSIAPNPLPSGTPEDRPAETG